MTSLDQYQEKFNNAEAKFDAKPNSVTANNLKIAREELESFIYKMTPKSEYQKKLEENQLKALVEVGRCFGLSL